MNCYSVSVVANDKLHQLKDAVHLSLDELAEDAERYLELFKQFKREGGKVDEDLSAELEVQVTVLQAHATSLGELIDELDSILVTDK